MTVATVKAVVTRFLTTDNPEVLAVKGAWGVGKTYAWNQLVRDSKDKIKLPSYCYVSLFGITSLAELKLAIFAKTQPAKQVGNKIDLQSINEDWFSIGLGGIKRLFAKLPRANDVPYLKHLSVGFDVLAPHLIHDIIICLDDFERLSDLIEPDALLGLISELKEEKNCKIALIFNEDELGGEDRTVQEISRKGRRQMRPLRWLSPRLGPFETQRESTRFLSIYET